MIAREIHHFLLLFLLLFSLVSAQNYEEEIHRSLFPDRFFFGTATSSYQIEGASVEDGRGVSNWDVFSHIPGKIENNDTGDVADDHYHRFMEDIDLMQSMGVNAYRFSISWTRILPRGRYGKVNREGISFYNKIINYLLEKGIEPFVTIHHHDLPYELDQRYGTWMSSLMQEDFVYYAKICFEEFGDRVKYWMTINEPNMVTLMGYTNGVYPPAHCSPPFGNCSAGNSDVEPLIVMHNMLLAHAKAVRLYRSHFQGKQGGFIGIVPHSPMFEPLREEESDREAMNRALAFVLAWVYDPLMYGDYPSEMRQILGSQLPSFTNEEKILIKNSLDFICINHYTTLYARDCLYSPCPDAGGVSDRPINGFVNFTGYRHGVPIGDPMGLKLSFVVPKGMEKLINYVKERYPSKPIFVTENGYSPPPNQGKKVEDILNDFNRINYHKSYLAAVARAIRNGADVRGYFVWSFIDNFEWVNGYSTRFGLIYVHRRTLRRLPKLSAHWFADFLAGGGGAHRVDGQPEVGESKSALTRNKNGVDSTTVIKKVDSN